MCGVVLYKNTTPRESIHLSERNNIDTLGSDKSNIKDYGRAICRVAPSQIRMKESGSFTLTVDTRDAKSPGFYTIVIYVLNWKKRDLRYYEGTDDSNGKESDDFLNNLLESGEAQVAETICLPHRSGVPRLAPVSEIWIVDDAATDTEAAIKKDDVSSSRENSDLRPAETVPPALSEFAIVRGDTVELGPPEGFDLIPVNIALSSSSGRSHSDSRYAYLCTRSVQIRPGAEVVVETILVWGSFEDVPKGYDSVELPIYRTKSDSKDNDDDDAGGKRTALAYLCYRTESLPADEKTTASTESKIASSAPEDSSKTNEDEATAPSEPVVDIKNMRRIADDLRKVNASLSEKLSRVMHLREEKRRLAGDSEEDRDGETYTSDASKRDSKSGSELTKGDGTDVAARLAMKSKNAEIIRQHQQNLDEWESLETALMQFRDDSNQKAMELQIRLDDKEAKGNEIEDSFADFKREITLASENSRTGKKIPKKKVREMESAERKKEESLERMRIANIKYRMQLRKLEKSIRAKEQLAEGLHLVDFEQLKIENQTLHEKIEERNEEIQKFVKKTTKAVQVLTHIKEKLFFMHDRHAKLRDELVDVDKNIASKRQELGRIKSDRDAHSARTKAAATKHSQKIFTGNKVLLADYESRKSHIRVLHGKIDALKKEFKLLASK
eukprot:g2166.t1